MREYLSTSFHYVFHHLVTAIIIHAECIVKGSSGLVEHQHAAVVQFTSTHLPPARILIKSCSIFVYGLIFTINELNENVNIHP